MSTRCNIIIEDSSDKLFFYRHSDGYPEETGKDLKEFVSNYKTGNYRDNVSQSAGWLIIRGREQMMSQHIRISKLLNDNLTSRMYDWKVGYYEPTTGLHGDIEYLYQINLSKKTLCTYKVNYSGKKTLIETYEF